MARFGRQRRVKRQHIGATDHLVFLRIRDAPFTLLGLAVTGAFVVKHRHAEGLAAPRHSRTDIAIAQDAERFTVEVDAESAESSVLDRIAITAEGAIPLRDAPRAAQQQRQRQVGRWFDHRPRRVRHHDPLLGRIGRVDVVVAHGVVRNQLERMPAVDQVTADGDVKNGAEHIAIANAFGDLGLRKVAPTRRENHFMFRGKRFEAFAYRVECH